MEKQTSVQKGDSFEKKAYDLLKEMLENNELFVSGKKSKIIRGKAYPSKDTPNNVVIDISIETYLENATNYSILTVIECKNLNRKVAIDDIRELNSKLNEIGEHNTKGILISNNLFQEGAYNYAVSKKIGLIQLTSNNKLDWINYRKEKLDKRIDSNELFVQFTSDDCAVREKFIANINNIAINNLADLLLECKIIDFYRHNEKYINIPFVKEERIEEIITRLKKHDVYNGKKLDTNKLCDFLSTVYPISFDFKTTLQDNLLGKIEFEPLKISISNNIISDENRWRFTLAHEIGHLILHYKLFKDRLIEKTDTESSISFRHFITDITSRRIELQANIFASHLLLPFATLRSVVIDYFNERNIKKGFLYLDKQQGNKELVFTLLYKISLEFGVSLEVAKIRLVTLKLLQDESDISLKSIIKRMAIGQ